jgi:hypothetical protein
LKRNFTDMHKKCFFSCLDCLWLRLFWSVFGQIFTHLGSLGALSGLGNDDIGTLMMISGYIFILFARKNILIYIRIMLNAILGCYRLFLFLLGTDFDLLVLP